MISWYVTKDLSIDTPPFTRNNRPPSFIISRRYTRLLIIHENKILRLIKWTNEQQCAWTAATNHKAIFQWHHWIVIVVAAHNHVQVFHYYVWKENVFCAWGRSFTLATPLVWSTLTTTSAVDLSRAMRSSGNTYETISFSCLSLCNNVSRSYKVKPTLFSDPFLGIIF